GGSKAVAAIDTAVPADLVVPFGSREADRIPRPPGIGPLLRHAFSTTSLVIGSVTIALTVAGFVTDAALGVVVSVVGLAWLGLDATRRAHDRRTVV
ncbi:MAG TPA: hypothetical protein PKB06_11025, partial [Actinotalea sp.]|nr:hypothetical protein [Actinotalea sp.]